MNRFTPAVMAFGLAAFANGSPAAKAAEPTPLSTPTPTVEARPAPVKVTPAPVVKMSPAATREMVARILKETSALRKLPIKNPVPSGVKSRAAVEQMIKKQLQSEVSAKEMIAAELYLKQLGLAPANFDLRSYYTSVMGEQIAGYYDDKANAFYTSEIVSPMLLETVMAHELTHALQDQNFDLSRLKKMPRHESDARLALVSLVEGDATLTMSRYMAASPLRILKSLTASLQMQGGSQLLTSGPRVLRENMAFPYIKGMVFASNLYKTAGWAGVSHGFTDVPQSTEQILHYEKYQSGEKPVKVELRDLTPLLGKDWTLLDHDVNGEMGLGLVVGEHLGDEKAADRAAAGWAGDRFAVYRGPEKAVLVVQDCLWDSEFDAREWGEAYARSTTKRFGVKSQQRGAVQVWNATSSGVWLERRGRRVLILEGTVGAFNVDTMLSALWRPSKK